jgi:hypothetical protein
MHNSLIHKAAAHDDQLCTNEMVAMVMLAGGPRMSA